MLGGWLRIYVTKHTKKFKGCQEESIQERPSQSNVSGTEFMVLDPDKSVTTGRKKKDQGSF